MKFTFSPIFIKETTRYIDKSVLDNIDFDDPVWDGLKNPSFPFQKRINTKKELIDFLVERPKEETIEEFNNPQPVKRTFSLPSQVEGVINHSNCKFGLILRNTGSSVLEDYKVYIDFENVISIDTVNKRTGMFDIHYTYNVSFYSDSPLSCVFEPKEKILVQGDSIVIDEICFKPKPEEYTSVIRWCLFSRDYKTNGELSFIIHPVFEENERGFYVDSSNQIIPPSESICNKYTFE